MTMDLTKAELVEEIDRLKGEAELKELNTLEAVRVAEEALATSEEASIISSEEVDALKEELAAAEETKEASIEEGIGDSLAELQMYREMPAATLPQKIVEWCKTAHNVDYGADNILIRDLRVDKVYFSVLNAVKVRPTQQMGINMANGELCEPPVHNHTWYQEKDGDVPVCRCGSFRSAEDTD